MDGDENADACFNPSSDGGSSLTAYGQARIASHPFVSILLLMEVVP